MSERPKTAYAHLKVRMKEPLRADLEEAARDRGVSMNAEVVRRLERSFSEQEALGGPEMQSLAYLMVAAFAMAGQHSAGGKPDWIKDRDAYRAGVLGVLDALLIGLPDSTDEEAALVIEALKGRLLSRIMSRKMMEEGQKK